MLVEDAVVSKQTNLVRDDIYIGKIAEDMQVLCPEVRRTVLESVSVVNKM